MTNTLSFVILSTGLESLKELRGALTSDDRARLLAGGDDAEQLFAELQRLRPDAAVVAIGAEVEPTLRFVERVASECPRTAIICASRDASPDLILRSLRAGAREFLRLPLIAEEFKTVLERTAEFCASQVQEPRKKGRTIAVFSSKGGCGTSFIAANLAAALSPAKTVLADLNLQSGDMALFLGVEPKYSIADLVENRARVDDQLLRTYLAPHSASLSLLAAPREADSADDIEPEHVYEVIEILRGRHDYVVIDPQHTFDAITLAALDQADEILLVLTLDIPAIRCAQRALAIFDRLGYPRHKIRVVVNRFSKQIDLELREVERFLGERVTGYVQSDYSTAVTSINLGQPLVESVPDSKLAAEIRQIAAQVSGQPLAAPAGDAAPARRLLGSLLRRPNRAAEAAKQAALNRGREAAA